MELSLAEAARLLGKSERQLRYQIKIGNLPARKLDGRWRIHRDDLPISDGQQKALERKSERAVRIAQQVLGDTSRAESKKRYSVRELRAYQHSAPVYRDLVATFGPEHPAAGFLREALMLLASGCHEYQAREKAAYYARAREQASRAVMTLLLDTDEQQHELVAQLEQAVVPALGGLIRQAERRERRR